MSDKVALVTMLSKDFMPGYVAFMKSLLYHNPWFDLPVVIMDIDLEQKDRNLCESVYSNLVFKKPRKNDYKNVNWRRTKPWLWNTYYTLDIFGYTQYDRIVFIDIDTLVLGDINYLFECTTKHGIAGVLGYDTSKDILRSDINAGVMIVNHSKLSQNIHRRLIKFAEQGFPFPEQDTINKCLRNKIDFLPKEYNIEKRMLFSRNYPFDIEDVKILHFVSLKPWQDKFIKGSYKKEREDFGELEKLWWEYHG